MEAVREKPKLKKPKKKCSSVPSKIEQPFLQEPSVNAEEEKASSEVKPVETVVLKQVPDENVTNADPVSFDHTEKQHSIEEESPVLKDNENSSQRFVEEPAAIVTYPHLEVQKTSVILEKNADAKYPCLEEIVKSPEENLKLKLSMLNKLEESSNEKLNVRHLTPERVASSNGCVKQLYPNVSIKTMERLESIDSGKTLVQTQTETCLNTTHSEALRSYHEYMEQLSFSMEGYPLFDLVKDYQNSRKRSTEDRSQIKSLNSKAKRNKSTLWKQVEKSTQCTGKCEDGNKVAITKNYKILELDDEKFKDITGFTRKLTESILSDGFNSYLDQVSNMKIEQNLYNLVQHLNHSNQHLSESSQGPNRNYNMEILRKCISILFHFQRVYTRDKEFLSRCQKWLSHLVFVLLQNSPLKSDYTFILNHVIRCPNGIKTWATQLVQLPRFSCSKEEREKYNCKCLYYSLLLLYLILNPAYDREHFLKNLKGCKYENDDGNFIFLDSEGEEEEIFEPVKEWTSDDVISLLTQVPLDGMFEHATIEHKDGASVRILPTEDNMLKMFGFSNALLNILFSGLSNYYKETLTPVINHVCGMIRKVVNYVTTHWTISSASFQEKSALQAEYDRFVFHVIYHLSTFNKLGVWNHLSVLPYENVSKKMQWHLLWIFHVHYADAEEVYGTKDVDSKLQDPNTLKYFIEKMKSLEKSDQMYLLHAYKSIALCGTAEENLISFIMEEVYLLAFVENSLHHLTEYSTAVIVSIVEKYPKLLTVLFKIVQKQEDVAIDFSKNLFRKLILDEWVPTADDIREISDCILSNDLSSPINYLARNLIEKMNFGFSPGGELFLPIDLHREVAILVLQAYMRYDSNANKWSVSKGLNQMVQLNRIMFYKSEDDGFITWAWNILFSLKMHVLDQKNPPWVQIYDGVFDFDLPDPYEQLWLQPLLKGFEENHPAACYIFLVMTNVGHNIKKLLTTGMNCWSSLVKSQQYKIAIQALYYILPFFVKHLEELLSQTQFIEMVSVLLTIDMDTLPTGSGEAVVGNVLHEMAALIKHQIFQASALTVECAAPLMTLWLNLLLKVLLDLEGKSSKLKDFTKQAHFLLDLIVKIASLDSYTRNKMTDMLYDFGNPLCSPSSVSQSSFFSKWFSQNVETLTILRKLTLPSYPWLAWYVLRAETKQKHVQEIWNSVQKLIGKDAMSPSSALKKSCSSLKLPEPVLDSLPLYRWGIQILDIKVNHAALPLLYQQFFYYFFQRIITPGSQKPVSMGLEYFKDRNAGMLTCLRKHAQNASEFYREQLQCPKDSESDSSSGGNSPCGNVKKSIEEMALNAELCRVFRAFYVWIDDKNLHLPSLCLSALDPKYCAHRLNDILNNDQRDWIDLVSMSRLKNELDTKIHSFGLPRSPSISSQCSSESEIGEAVYEPEPLDNCSPKQVEPLNLQMEPPVLHIDDSLLSNPNALLKLIEEKQTIIFDKARAYAQIESKLKKANDDYKMLAPDEYIIQDLMVTEFKSCYKGANCAGPAKFNLKIQKHHTNQKVESKLESIYVQQRALQEQLLNLQVSDLCHASIIIESYIGALARKLESTTGEEAAMYRNAGISIFYRQIQSLNRVIMSVKSYSPSRSFFATSIESLGNVFIRDQEDQLCDLAQAILNYPEAGELAFNLFNPNIASFPVFQDVYFSILSFIKHRSPNAIFVLLKKVDMDYILKNKETSFTDRRNLFKKICQTLLQCGPVVPEDLEMIFHILRRHYRNVLSWMFPELYEDAVSFLLDGMETGNLAISLWYDTFKCLGCPSLEDSSDASAIQAALKKVSDNMLLPPHQQIFVSSPPVNVFEVQQTLSRVHEKFMTKRNSANLYLAYKAHFKPFGIFIALLSHSMLSMLNDFSEANNGMQILNISDLWKHLQNAFYPWLHPVIEREHFKFPWEDDQINDARLMHQIFTMCLTNFHEKLLNYNCEKSILSFVWEFYVETYVLPNYRHYSVEVFHSEMTSLPWNQFYPDSKDIEGMCSVLQSNLLESKEFLSKISYKIPWIDVMREVSTTKPPEFIRRYLSTLGKLLIVSAKWDKVNPCHKNSKAVEDLCWYYLSLEDIESLLDLYFTNTDPNLLLNEEQPNSSDAFIVQFLKIICCMTDSSCTLQNTHTTHKRLLYLCKLMTALSSCTLPSNLANLKPTKFKWIIPSLLTDIDNIISKGVKPNQQGSSALPLVREVILFLNNVTEAQLEIVLVQSVVDWLESHPHSPLLLPCLQTATQCLTHMDCAVVVVESCIMVRFKSEFHDASEAKTTWELIHSSFLIPSTMTDEFVTACLRKNTLLAYYCHVQGRTKHSTAEDKRILLFNIIDKIQRFKITETDETKCLLLWDCILELATSLALENNYQVVKMALKSFCSGLSKLGEDKSGYLLIFGQSSSNSVNFRFLCRILAAFLHYQLPKNASVRLQPLSPGYIPLGDNRLPDPSFSPGPSDPAPSDEACKAVESCKALLKNTHYSAFHEVIRSAMTYLLDPRNCIVDSKAFLKNCACDVFPKCPYLYALSSYSLG